MQNKKSLYSELLKPLNITRVFVYRTGKLFLDRGGVSDRKRSAGLTWFVHHGLLMLLGQELTEILSEKKKKIRLWKWILRREP